MKQQRFIPLTAALGGGAALILRIRHIRTGFEPDTGLPIPGTPAGLALLILLLVLAAVLLASIFRLPKEGDPGPLLPGDFPLTSPLPPALLTAGVLLVAASGLADLLEGCGTGNLLALMRSAADPYGAAPPSEAVSGFAPYTQLLLGALSLLSAAAMLLVTVSCRRQKPLKAPSLLLVPPVALVARLVLVYRLDSVNPALSAYYVELLALVFLTLAFYRLSSFAFQAGRTRRFTLYAAPAVTLSFAALAEAGPHLSAPLLHTGGALFLLGFLAVRLAGPAGPPPKQPDDVSSGTAPS